MTGLSSFSKVGDLLEDDEEEERDRVSVAACARFKVAEDAYTSKGSKEEVLKIFEEAEAFMAPLLNNSGLMGLGGQELQAVLKGRLHQAVILAQLEHIPDRWTRVKRLAEDVLQFDSGNCHGHWLRALALQNATSGARSDEAEIEMRRAIDCARSQGRTNEVQQWEAELQRLLDSKGGAASKAASEVVSEPAVADTNVAGAAADLQSVPPRSDGKVAAENKSDKASEKKGLAVQKGFLTKRNSKNAAAASSTASAHPASPTAVVASEGTIRAEPGKASVPSCEAELSTETHELLREQRRQLEEQRAQIDTLRQQLQEEQQRLQDQRGESSRRQQSLKERVDAISAEFETALQGEAMAIEGRSAANSVRLARERRELGSLRRSLAAATEAKEHQQSARTWAEGQHQRYIEVSTELLTLQEMCTREHRERQDTSRQHVAEMRDLAKRMGDLKGATKTLRDQMRLKTAGTPYGDKQEPDMQRLAESAVDFQALPFSTKFMAFLDDGTVLRLVGLAVLLGMLLMLAAAVEGFGRYRCRFVCAG
mmetsp:Transcript_98728/g.247407  ORF Transcript_98728/g.247407 Transcript_98728/m.247407 type:complete len:539 (-) Transcript_98728:21-1637(-)